MIVMYCKVVHCTALWFLYNIDIIQLINIIAHTNMYPLSNILTYNNIISRLATCYLLPATCVADVLGEFWRIRMLKDGEHVSDYS